MPQVPGAGAALVRGLALDAVSDLAAGHEPVGAVRSDGPGVDEPLRRHQTGVVAFDAARVVGQLAMEPGLLVVVPADPSRSAEHRQGRPYPGLGQARLPGQTGLIDVRVEGQQRREQVGVLGDIRRGQGRQQGALAGEPSGGLDGEHEREAGSGQGELQGGGAVAVRRGVDGQAL